MSGRIAAHLRAIVLPCLVLLAMSTAGSGWAATFRFDPISPTNVPPAPLVVEPWEFYPTLIWDGAGGTAPQDSPYLDGGTIQNVRFRVTQILTPITKVTIRVMITHEHLHDLRLTLKAPDGTSVRLADSLGSVNADSVLEPLGGFGVPGVGVAANYVEFTSQNDPMPASIQDPTILVNNQSRVPPGLYQPTANLSAFNGRTTSANGIWRLVVEDLRTKNTPNTTSDEGTFYDARLYITQQGGERVWTGRSNPVNNLWSDEDNWDDLFGPPDPDQSNALIFPANAATFTPQNDMGGLEISGVGFSGGSYTVTGLAVTVTDRARFYNNSNLTNTWQIPSAMEAGEVILDSSGNGVLRLNSVWSGAGGLTKEGGSRVELLQANTYTGLTQVRLGILDALNNGALGNGSETRIYDRGTLRVGANINLTETVVVRGAGAATVGSPPIGALIFTDGGSIDELTLADDQGGTLRVLAGAATIDDVTASDPGTYSLSVTNAGTLTVAAGALPGVTDLSLSGGTNVFSAAQPNLRDLTLSGGADVNGAGLTISGAITSRANADVSQITNTVNLGGSNRTIRVDAGAAGTGGGANTTSSDLQFTAAISNGSITKTGGGVMRFAGAAGVNATVAQGTLAGAGAIGSITVQGDAVLSPAGTIAATGNVTLATGSALILPTAATPLVTSTGTVALNGTGGASGAILQPYSGGGALIIDALAVTGIFSGMADGDGIEYDAPGVGEVTLDAAGGRSLAFNPGTAISVDESDGSFDVTVTPQNGAAQPVLRVFGGGARHGVNLDLLGALVNGTYVFTVPILDNFVDSGDVTTTLAIIPQDGSLVTNSLRLTINDNDTSDQKACGFGTGLTVFLLLGFGLLLNTRLRRR